MNEFPTTVSECHYVIRQRNETIAKLDRELIALKTERDSRGVAAELIRDVNNFPVIDDCLTNVRHVPFKLGDLFTSWLTATGLTEETQYVRTTLRQQFNDLLKLNGFIVKVGAKLWRVSPSYDFTLSKATKLSWRKAGQVEGTYLVPELS